jgi:hypothetical protein
MVGLLSDTKMNVKRVFEKEVATRVDPACGYVIR